MKSNAFWRKRYMTTIASLRSICLNDLYRHKDLWELAVEGDIHGVVSVLQMSVPRMPNRRKKSEEMPLCWLCRENDTSFEKRDCAPLFPVCWGDGLNTLVWFAQLSPRPRGWVTQASSFAKSESVFKVYLLSVVMKTKQRLLNRHLCSGTHPRYSSAWIKSACDCTVLMNIL